MLYKKIHRQHVRKWKDGREFRFKNVPTVFKISGKPYIRRKYFEGYRICSGGWVLIVLSRGRIICGDVEWLD